jgi:hypothetical protein
LIYFVLKEFDGLYVAKNFGKSSAEGKRRENISKKSAEKIPKSLKFGKKIPESRGKLLGFSNPKNLRTLFSE